ncbi:MAG: PilN domain-containing protein, partial [Candidatus Rifleibacteriota bacterium]
EVTELLAEQEVMKKYSSVFSVLNENRRNNSSILIEIASLTPKQIFLTATEFNFSQSPASFKLLGHADNSDSIFEYLNILGKSNVFSNPILDKTQEVPIDETRYFLRFELSGKIKDSSLKGTGEKAGSEGGAGAEEDFFEEP